MCEKVFYLFISYQICQFNSYNVVCRAGSYQLLFFSLPRSIRPIPSDFANRQLEAQCRELESKSARVDPPVTDTVSDEDEFEEIPSVNSAEATDPS